MTNLAAITWDINAGSIIVSLIVATLTGVAGWLLGGRHAAEKVRANLSAEIAGVNRALSEFKSCVQDLSRTTEGIEGRLHEGAEAMARMTERISAGEKALSDCQRTCSATYVTRADAAGTNQETRIKFAKIFERLDLIGQRLASAEATIRTPPFAVQT